MWAGVLIFWPFWSPLFLAATFTTICFPAYLGILKLMGGGRRTLASILTCLLFVLIFLIPALWGAWSVAESARPEIVKLAGNLEAGVEKAGGVVPSLKTLTEDEDFRKFVQSTKDTFLSIASVLPGGVDGENFGEPGAKEQPEKTESGVPSVTIEEASRPETDSELDEVSKVIEENQKAGSAAFTILGRVTRIVVRLVFDVFGFVVQFLLMIFLMFYFFKDGEQILAGFRRALPVAPAFQGKVIDTFKQVVRSILRGTLVTAGLQGLIAGITFHFVFDNTSGVFWGVVTGICGLVPIAGTGLVTVPVIVYLLISQSYGAATAVFVVAGVIGMMDNVVRPFILGGDLRLHPVWILLSFLGGVSAFGPVGIVLGPMVVVLIGTVLALVRMDDPVDSSAIQ